MANMKNNKGSKNPKGILGRNVSEVGKIGGSRTSRTSNSKGSTGVGKSNVTPKTMNLMKKSGAISKAPSAVVARTEAINMIKAIKQDLLPLNNIRSVTGNSGLTASGLQKLAAGNKKIAQLEKLVKKWS